MFFERVSWNSRLKICYYAIHNKLERKYFVILYHVQSYLNSKGKEFMKRGRFLEEEKKIAICLYFFEYLLNLREHFYEYLITKYYFYLQCFIRKHNYFNRTSNALYER